ncbi:hypothetical protein NFI96_020963, partial [Prochilodus magdalenae]
MFDEVFMKSYINRLLEIVREGSSFARVKLEKEMMEKTVEMFEKEKELILRITADQLLLQSLRDTKFEVYLTDPVLVSGILLGHFLKLPMVFNVRWTVHSEGHYAIAPSPVSYIPLPMSELPDRMNFIQRVKNFFLYFVTEFQIIYYLSSTYDALCKQICGPEVNYFEIVQGADLWLFRGDFVFEFPRPTMPNIVYMAGFQCKPAKPLPQELEDFVQSSGEHGIIVMSLGTFVEKLPRDVTNAIAEAFAELPQKVIWRYIGERPSTLGNNTLLMDWIPQNDLLGHPKTRAFVSHGGTNGVQEAIYHGVPLVGLGLIWDQPDNLSKMVARGAAKTVKFATMDKTSFLQAVRDVLYEPSYRENMQRLSRLHRDAPIEPLDNAVFWTEFVMRHGVILHFYLNRTAFSATMNGQKLLACALVLASLLVAPIQGGNILVFPVDGSHWVNMKFLIEALHAKGHNITVIRAADSWFIKETSPLYTSITIPSTAIFDEVFMKSYINRLLEILREGSTFARVKLEKETWEKAAEMFEKEKDLLMRLTADQQLVQSLRDTKFEVYITDPVLVSCILLGRFLKLPMVFNVRWTVHNEGHFAIAPSPLSYVPLPMTELPNRMSFFQRVLNVILYIVIELQVSYYLSSNYDALCKQICGPEVNYFEIVQGADLWLFRGDFVFEYPRPTMPNIIYMGGFQCKPAKPLPQELEDFVQSSGEHGIIVMSLGTLVEQIPRDVTNAIAEAFAELPQKVIWRYIGERPSTLGNNTLLMDWIPQNDLLGHPKTRAFVSHGGTNGVQEAIYHGVPLVGLGLIWDQPDNLSKMTARGAAKTVTFATMDKTSFLQAVRDVLYEPSYRENMQRLSRLHRDVPIEPLDKAVFWTEFVMRHGGAPHLRTESYKMP